MCCTSQALQQAAHLQLQSHLCFQESRPVVEAYSKLWVIWAKSLLLNLDVSQAQAIRLVVLSLRAAARGNHANPTPPSQRSAMPSGTVRQHRGKLHLTKSIVGGPPTVRSDRANHHVTIYADERQRFLEITSVPALARPSPGCR